MNRLKIVEEFYANAYIFYKYCEIFEKHIYHLLDYTCIITTSNLENSSQIKKYFSLLSYISINILEFAKTCQNSCVLFQNICKCTQNHSCF